MRASFWLVHARPESQFSRGEAVGLRGHTVSRADSVASADYSDQSEDSPARTCDPDYETRTRIPEAGHRYRVVFGARSGRCHQ